MNFISIRLHYDKDYGQIKNINRKKFSIIRSKLETTIYLYIVFIIKKNFDDSLEENIFLKDFLVAIAEEIENLMQVDFWLFLKGAIKKKGGKKPWILSWSFR